MAAKTTTASRGGGRSGRGGAGVAAAGFGFISGFQQAEAENRSLEFQAQMAEWNAGILLQEAGYTEQFAKRSELQFRLQSEQFLSAQTVEASASGFSTESGSIRELLVQSQVEAEADAFAILFKGEFEAFKSRTQARNLQRQASRLRSLKQDPTVAGVTSAVGSAASFF